MTGCPLGLVSLQRNHSKLKLPVFKGLEMEKYSFLNYTDTERKYFKKLYDIARG
jgi:hypothetical protein